MWTEDGSFNFDALAALSAEERALRLSEMGEAVRQSSVDRSEGSGGEDVEGGDGGDAELEPVRLNDDGTVSFVFSTEQRDRYQTRFVGWRLGSYKRNPVFLWMHRTWGGLPIGRTVRVSVDDKKRLIGDVKFDADEVNNPLAYQVERMYRERYLNACSIHARPSKRLWMADLPETDPYYDKRGGLLYRDNELFEVSGVLIGGNASALAQRDLGDLAGLMPDWMKRLSPDGDLDRLAQALRPVLIERLLKDDDVLAQLRATLRAPAAEPAPAPAPEPAAEPAPAPAPEPEPQRTHPFAWF